MIHFLTKLLLVSDSYAYRILSNSDELHEVSPTIPIGTIVGKVDNIEIRRIPAHVRRWEIHPLLLLGWRQWEFVLSVKGKTDPCSIQDGEDGQVLWTRRGDPINHLSIYNTKLRGQIHVVKCKNFCTTLSMDAK